MKDLDNLKGSRMLQLRVFKEAPDTSKLLSYFDETFREYSKPLIMNNTFVKQF